MTRVLTIVASLSLISCGSSVTAPPLSENPRPTGTFFLVRSAQDSSSSVVAPPAGVGNSCVTFVSRLKFVASDSVIATHQFVLPSQGGNNTIVTETDAGAATAIDVGTFRLSYPTRVDTASAQLSNGAVTQLTVNEHFASSTACPTARLRLSYRLQAP